MTLLPLVSRVGGRRATGRRVRTSGRVAVVAGLLACATALGGCADLRLETPPPPTPTPDAAEIVRERTARDATELAALATEAALSAPEAVATVLGRIAEVSLAHAEAFGGVYDPFPGATAEPTATPDVGAGATVAPTPTPPPADAAAVLDALATTGATARADADAAPDGDRARLLASVWVSRTLLGETLSAAVAAAAAPDPAAPPTTTPTGPPPVPAEPPAGVDVADLSTLVRSEDAAGLVWEVVAARSADAARAEATVRAAFHRERAEAWAVAAGLARTDADPRLATYDLPEALIVDGATAEAMAAVTGEVEAALGVTYTSLVARADAQARASLLDAMLDQVRRGLPVGAPAPAFPGLPERA